jgi:hypothetical protein
LVVIPTPGVEGYHKVLGDRDFSSDSEDDDEWRHFKRTIRSFV